ncbi:MAG TPA: radical SAM protein [Myxococcota bacterium]|nr:radical SAM protein [Myxococcota bacterium]
MSNSHAAGASFHRYHIERSEQGYRVVGEGLLIWEPTLIEAVERREELEESGWCHVLLPRPTAGVSSSHDFEGLVYGPVASRRLGRSLGVDLTPPGCRVCSFNCVYCEYATGLREDRGVRWPTPGDVGAALNQALLRTGPLDSITISGHGEPTLHPHFGAVVAAVLAESRRSRPRVPVRILTNGTRVLRAEVRAALDRLDERIVKVDADAERVCRPGHRSPLGAIVASLATLRDVTLQSCFVQGEVGNTSAAALREWADLVAEVRPHGVQIYTIDRPARAFDVRPVSAAELEEIACSLRAWTGIEAQVFA